MNERTIAAIAAGLASACQPDLGGVGTGGGVSGVVTATGSTGDGTSTGLLTSDDADATSASGGPSSSGGSTDPGVDETTTTDSGSSDTGDDPLPPPSPFGEPVPVAFVNDAFATDDDPTLRSDQLEMYFASTRYGSEDVFVTVRASVGLGWSIPQPVWELNSGLSETTPELSHDGLLMVLASNRRGDGLEPYYSTRASLVSPWNPPQPIPAVGSPSTEAAVTPQADGVTLMFCSDRMPSRGGTDIWRSRIDGALPSVIELQTVVELSSVGADCPGNSSGDMVWQSFGSTGPGSAGGEDLWLAQRTAAGDGFWPPYALAELNTTANDSDPWISADLTTIYFASDRAGTFDLYMAER